METGGTMEAYEKQARSSPFFRLPQELRDKVYEYYVDEEDGYFYDPDTKKLTLDGKRPVNLAL